MTSTDGDGRLKRVRGRVRRAAKVVLVNLLVLLALLMVTNLLSALILGTHPRRLFHTITGTGSHSGRAYELLPNYRDDRKHAKAIFDDYRAAADVRYVPFVEWSRKPYRGATTTIGRNGARVTPSPPKPVPPPPGERRPVVRFFGGSTMWGVGADDEGTIPAIFNRLHPEARVYNHGEPGFVSRQNLERLINEMTRHEPTDVVVFYEGVNDVAALCRSDTDLNGTGQETQIRDKLGHAKRGKEVEDLLWSRTADLLARATRRLRGKRDVYECAKDSARARRVAETVVRDWEMARLLARATCARFVAILQPVAYIGHPRLEQISHNPAAPLELSDYGTVGAQVKAVYPLWQRLAGRSGMRWLHDFTRAYDGNDLLYIDHVHVTRAGNEIMARKISNLLPSRLSVERGCRPTL